MNITLLCNAFNLIAKIICDNFPVKKIAHYNELTDSNPATTYLLRIGSLVCYARSFGSLWSLKIHDFQEIHEFILNTFKVSLIWDKRSTKKSNFK